MSFESFGEVDPVPGKRITTPLHYIACFRQSVSSKTFSVLKVKVKKIIKKIIKKLISDKRWNNQVAFVQNNNSIKPSWFGLTMLVEKKFKYKKETILNRLDKLGIENRPIISGNFLKQPALRKYRINQKSNDFPNANYIHEYGLFIGLKNKILKNEEIKKFANIFFKSFNS